MSLNVASSIQCSPISKPTSTSLEYSSPPSSSSSSSSFEGIGELVISIALCNIPKVFGVYFECGNNNGSFLNYFSDGNL
jgi:hypothetical protein